jgi:hypothetical protein
MTFFANPAYITPSSTEYIKGILIYILIRRTAYFLYKWKLLELNYSNTIVKEEEFNTLEFNSKLFIIYLLLLFTTLYRPYNQNTTNCYNE